MLHILIQINLKQKKNKYVNTLLYISTRFKSNDNNLLQQKKKKRRFYKYHAEKSGESNQLTINILRNVLILSSLIP